MNDNIKQAADLKAGTGLTGFPLLLGNAALTLAAQRYGTFYDLVKPGGPWDYKEQDPAGIAQGKSKYEDFGNFNYGATGVAAGFSEGQLLRLAGRAHVQQGSPGGEGEAVGRIKALLGVGGKAPFGDQQSDQDMIKNGIKYFQNNCHR